MPKSRRRVRRIREEIEAANRVAAQLLGRLALIYSMEGGPQLALRFLQQTGHVRANDIVLRNIDRRRCCTGPRSDLQGRARGPSLVHPPDGAAAPAQYTFMLPGTIELTVRRTHRARCLTAWDELKQLFVLAAACSLSSMVWPSGRWIMPWRHFRSSPAASGMYSRATLHSGCRRSRVSKRARSASAFNRMAEAVQDKVQAERKAHEAEARLDERREMALLVEQRVEEERRLIAHELHDEFGQSVTAIRSLAMAIAAQGGQRDPQTGDAARLISDEAARLYDAMHGLIPRLMPMSLDTLGLADTLENLVRDWQRRNPSVKLSCGTIWHAELGPSVTLAIYRVVQEGLINALRHAQASHVDIDVDPIHAAHRGDVSDDGIGMPAAETPPGHFGLRGLSERIARLGGDFKVGRMRAARGTPDRRDTVVSQRLRGPPWFGTASRRAAHDPRVAGRRPRSGSHGIPPAVAVAG